jgi:hypothetical protein
VAVLTLLAALASGCGSSGSSGEGVASLDGNAAAAEDQTSSETASEDPEEAALAWARCMRTEGIDVPDPQVEDGRVLIRPGAGTGRALRETSREKFEAATEKCGTPFGNAGPPQLSEEQREEMQETLLSFARCMRENGVDMPDPDFSGSGPFRMGGPGAGIDPDSPTFQKAREACESILQDSGFGPRGGPPPGGNRSQSGQPQGGQS